MARRILLTCAVIGLIGMLAASTAHPPPAQAAGDVGYIDFAYFLRAAGTNADAILTPTSEKPQSKLWFNDGRWWAVLLNPAARAHHIYALNRAAQRWLDTGVSADNRPQTEADCLWDGRHLYIVSGGGGVSTGADLDARLYRYSYVGGTYRLDSGFPVTVRSGGAETITIDKDSTGALWVAYTQYSIVYVNLSRGADSSWGAPLPLPAAGANTAVAPDDIAALVAYNGAVGVFWSNQNDGGFYFAYHRDGAADDRWSGSVVLRQAGLADDHISIKSFQNDPAGNVLVAVKTSFNMPGQPQVILLAGRRQSSGGLAWRSAIVSDGSQRQTRPIVLIDGSNRQVYVFMAGEGGGLIHYKHSSIDRLSFDPAAKGTVLIGSASYPFLNNPTATKQTVNAATGIAVLASYDNESHPSANPAATDVYAHNTLALAAPLGGHRTYLPLVRR
jgi:hypothetical protein